MPKPQPLKLRRVPLGVPVLRGLGEECQASPSKTDFTFPSRVHSLEHVHDAGFKRRHRLLPSTSRPSRLVLVEQWPRASSTQAFRGQGS